MTWREFWNIMTKTMLKWIDKVIAAHPEVFPDGRRSAIIVFDRARAQQKALDLGLMQKLGMRREQAIAHPPNSPDFNAPVEHAHALLKAEVKKAFAEDARIQTSAQVKQLIQRVWKGQHKRAQMRGQAGALITPAIVDAACAKMERTYDQVISRSGQWGAKSA